MKKPVSAALLSALVFPGLGQFYLKRRLRGWLFLTPCALALAYAVNHVFHIAFALSEKITSGVLPPEIDVLLDYVHRTLPANAPFLGSATLVILACWISSTIDAAIVGAQIEMQERAAKPAAAP